MQLNTTPAFPGENGRTAGRGHANIPVVSLTAHSDAQTAREGITAGGCAFLTKPCQLEELGLARPTPWRGKSLSGQNVPLQIE